MNNYIGVSMIILGILYLAIGISLLVIFRPPEIPPQYPCVTVHKEGNKTVFRYNDGSEVKNEYKEPKQASKNTSKIVSVDSNGFTISTPKRKEKND